MEEDLKSDGADPTSIRVTKDFLAGLTMPDFLAVKIAAIALLAVVAVAAAIAERMVGKVARGEYPLDRVWETGSRAEILACRGDGRETAKDRPNLVFVGPSALLCWLPHPDTADAIAEKATNTGCHLVSMCALGQGYPRTAAYIEKFGADFDGWFVIGVSRQMIARNLVAREAAVRGKQAILSCFDSVVLREETRLLGYPMASGTGLRLWDSRSFFYVNRLGLDPPFLRKRSYEHYEPRVEMSVKFATEETGPLDRETLQRHLALLGRVVERVRKNGRAGIALVETPWVDSCMEELRTEEWHEQEREYREAMRAWSQEHGVPWLDLAHGLGAKVEDFSDPRHIGNPDLRRRFLESVTVELIGKGSEALR